MARKPTEQAEFQFKQVEQGAMSVVSGLKAKNDDISVAFYNSSVAMVHLARGLGSLAIGLRATFQLLEDVNRKLDAQDRKGRSSRTS